MTQFSRVAFADRDIQAQTANAITSRLQEVEPEHRAVITRQLENSSLNPEQIPTVYRIGPHSTLFLSDPGEL